MIDALLYLLVFLIVGGLLFWAIKTVCAAFGVPPPIVAVINVVFVIFIVLAILSIFFGGSELPHPVWRH